MAFPDDDPASLGGNYLVRHWRGGLSLTKAFWLNGVAGWILFSLGVPYLMQHLHELVGSLRFSAIVWLAFILLFFGYAIWAQVGIWRAAGFHVGRGGAEPSAIMARVMVGFASVALLVPLHNLTLQGVEFGSLAFGYDPIGNEARLALSRDGRTLSVTGNLTAGSSERFAAAVAGAPRLRMVALESDGGRIFEGQRMAALVKARGLDTRVDDHCASACTFVLIAGRHRVIGPDAGVGFHQPSFPGMEESERTAMIEEMRQLYREGGISDAFLDHVLRVPPEDIWYPSNEELIAARVITEAIPPPVVIEEEVIED
ncbi:MAG TPA: hypothetical protein VLK25_08630 [Allosphingosinicella sp.]|nr:hypothetical protein [Allosphingosinicella sp.]